MPKFHVDITRRLECSTTITVHAKTEDEAEAKALDAVQGSTLTWNIADQYDWQEEADECEVTNIDQA